MKILFLTNHLVVGGIETNIVLLTRSISGRGHQVTVASRGGALVTPFIEAGGKHQEIPLHASPIALLRSAREVAALVARESFDVVHVFSASAAVLWAITRLMLRVKGMDRPPVVASVMGLQNSPDEPEIKIRLRVLLTSWGAKRLVVMSPAINAVVSQVPIDKSKVVHLSVVGVDVPESLVDVQRQRPDVRSELGLRASEKAVMTVGNLEPRKSHELFIRAADILMSNRDDLRFFLIGEGHLRSALANEIGRTKAPSKIEMLGQRHDVPRLLTACDVYVRPGVVEGFAGITVLEAQALEIPVVSFETKDVKLAIEDGLTGMLVPRGDVERLAVAIEDIVDDPALARRLGESGRRHVQNHYSIHSITESLLDLYSQVA